MTKHITLTGGSRRHHSQAMLVLTAASALILSFVIADASAQGCSAGCNLKHKERSR